MNSEAYPCILWYSKEVGKGSEAEEAAKEDGRVNHSIALYSGV